MSAALAEGFLKVDSPFSTGMDTCQCSQLVLLSNVHTSPEFALRYQ